MLIRLKNIWWFDNLQSNLSNPKNFEYNNLKQLKLNKILRIYIIFDKNLLLIFQIMNARS